MESESAFWLMRLVREFQILAGHLVWSDDNEIASALDAVLQAIPVTTAAEQLLVSGLVSRFLLRWQLRKHIVAQKSHCCLADVERCLNVGTLRGLSGSHTAEGQCQPNTRRTLARQIKQFIDENYRNRVRLDSLSKAIGCSPSHMEREFARAYSQSIHAYLLQVRTSAAIQLLRHSDVKVEAVALDVGFTTRASLYRSLKRFGAGTPAEIRRKTLATGSHLLAL